MEVRCTKKPDAVFTASGFLVHGEFWSLEGVDDVRENVADGRAEQRQDDDDDDGDQNQDQGIFYEALAFFTRLIHHDDFSSENDGYWMIQIELMLR